MSEKAELFLESKGLDLSRCVIQDITNDYKPSIPLVEWLDEFQQANDQWVNVDERLPSTPKNKNQ